jgi:hypothetical protein
MVSIVHYVYVEDLPALHWVCFTLLHLKILGYFCKKLSFGTFSQFLYVRKQHFYYYI